MPQVTFGLNLGLAPGGSPGTTAPVLDLLDTVPPSASTNPDVARCNVGSTLRNTGGTAGSIFWLKTAMPNTWTALG